MGKARSLLAYGGLDGVVQRPLFHGETGIYPQFAIAASGYEIEDSLGRRFIDWSNGWGPVLLGYRHPDVEVAIRSQLEAGPTLSLMHPLEVEVASMLVEMIPSAEMVAFGKNGSDVLTGAVRVARAATGREMILQHGFHGFHDWWLCQNPSVKGVLPVLRRSVRSFPYNDLRALEKLLRKHGRHVAAVVMEPTSLHLPAPGYLEGVRELTRRAGALLVFDEMVTAFRLAPGGAQQLFDVVPDLTCIGKALGNGMPISGLVGKREYMQYLPATGYGMTFRGETLSLAAARAVLEVLRREPVADHLAGVGLQVRSALMTLFARHGIRCELSGHASRQSFVFQPAGGLGWEQVRDMFLRECLERGLITTGTLLPSLAMNQEGVERSLEVFDGALGAVATALGAGAADRHRPVGGSPFGPRSMVAHGFLDTIRTAAPDVMISGWLMLEDGPPDGVEVHCASGARVQARTLQRPDLQRVFPDRAGVTRSGFEAWLPGQALGESRDQEFELRFLRGGRCAFRCLVVRQTLTAQPTASGPFWLGDGVLYL